jgi:peptidoglycan/LPS O-acetylase OafA/YrhL
MPALDGLRGVAVAGVLLFHAGHLTGGYLGVDLFFVLSGYLITSLLVGEWRTDGRIALGAFWARRARRLLPALFGVLVGIGVYALLWAKPSELAQIRGDGLATLGYIANWHSVFDNRNYFDLFTAPSPLEHTWSLAIEEQFYLVWPLVVTVVLARWRTVRAVFAVALGGAVMSVAAMAVLYEPGRDPSRVYFGTDTRGSSILLGAGLAAVHRMWGHTSRRRGRAFLELAAVAAAVFLAATWSSVNGQDPWLYRGGLAACGVAVATIIAAAAHPIRGPISRALSIRPLRWLGAVSYGLYLWHWPVYVTLTPARTGLADWPLTALRIGVSVALAAVSFYVLEMPIRRGALRGWGPRVLTPVAAVAVITLLLATTIGAVSVPSFASSEVPPPVASANAVKALVVGDSVAYSLAARLGEVSAETDLDATNGAVIACTLADPGRPVRDFTGVVDEGVPRCDEGWSRGLAASDPDVAVLELGGLVLSDIRFDEGWAHACMPVFDSWLADRMTRAIEQLGSGGATVALVSAARPRFIGSPRDVDERVGCVNRAVRTAATEAANATVIDLDGFLCPGGACKQEIDGEVVREDGLHFSGPGGQAVAMWLAGELRRAVVG